jgi:hypothetical protein
MVTPDLLHLFLKEKIYVLPADRPKQAEVSIEPVVAHPQAQPHVPQAPQAAGPKSVPKLPPVVVAAPSGTELPAIPPKGLVLLIHNPEGPLDPALLTMLGKLATATEPNTALHVQLIGNMTQYPWPTAWNPWPAKLTLLLGWPAALLAKHRIAETNRILSFAGTTLIAAPHPQDLEADRALKATLWGLIQRTKA